MVEAVKSVEELKQVVTSLSATPGKLSGIVQVLAGADLQWMPSEGPWAIVQHLCHLRDLEREGFSVRIRKILSGTNPTLPDLDGEKLAIERAYIKQDSKTALADFAKARNETLATIRGLSEAQLALTGTQEKVGPVTLGKVLAMMLHHDREHIELVEGLARKAPSRRGEPALR